MSVADLLVTPEWWPVLFVPPLLALALVLALRSRERALVRLVGARVATPLRERGRRRRLARIACFVVGVAAASLALLQPAWGDGEEAAQERGVDVLVCLDVSRSMLARDQAPSRLLAARREIRRLAERAGGDRLGLVVFAGDARLAVPLTQDAATFVAIVDRMDPLSVARGGTDLGAALDAAAEALAGATGDHEVVLLLTDGEDNEGGGLRAAQRCARRGITVHTVGFGSRRGGKIPVQGDGGEVFVRDGDGDEVLSAADPAALTRIAEATGGTYVSAIDAPDALTALYDERVVPMARKAFGDRERRGRQSRFQWPLALGVALLLLDVCIGDRGAR